MKQRHTSLYMPRWMLFFHRHISALKTSMAQLSLSSFTTLMTFAVIGVALALPMGLYVLLNNIQGPGQGIHESAQISLYLGLDTTKSQTASLMQSLKSDKAISKVTYISQQEGLEAFQKQYGFSNVLAELKENPIPPVMVIEPTTTLQTPEQIQQLLNRLENLPNVRLAQLNTVWVERLNAILQLAHRLFYAVAVLFVLGVLLVIGNTIKLIIQHFIDEIIVIKLLGGTNRFIRLPFLYSGMLYGLAGSIIAWFLVDIAIFWLTPPINQLITLYNTEFHFQGMGLESTLFLLATGIVLGYIGSWLAVGKLITTIEPRQ